MNRSEEDKENDKKLKKQDKEPLLGHVSMVNSVVVTPNHVITADRDAHIRISRYPEGYIIDQFCLGHLKFVTAIELLDDDLLLSGGGDDYLLLWDYKKGKELKRFDVRDAILSHAQIRSIRVNDKNKGKDLPENYGDLIPCINRILVGDKLNENKDPLVLFTSCG